MDEYQQLINNQESSGFSQNNNNRPSSNYGLVFDYEEEENIKVGKKHEEKLDKILYEIGFGKFQYLLLLLCGFGWLADNLWLQVVILLLPRIQKHYSLNDVQIGFPNSALFVGMMLGSLFWGGHSDIHGRRDAFHWTLTITTIGALLCGFTPNFGLLNIFLVILGFGVGGAVPVDSSIILEFLPTKYHYIVTSLSVFVNLGAVLASYFAYIILPSYSCPDAAFHNLSQPCDVNISNNGWRYVFISLAIVNGLMAFWRVCLFKLPESPHYLLSNNKLQRVVDTLNQVAEYNGLSMRFTVNDLIQTHKNSEMEGITEENEGDQIALEHEPHSYNYNQSNPSSPHRFTLIESGIKTHWLLKLLGFDLNLVYNLFQPYYKLSTILIWAIWTFMALSYNLFTIFLPKYLKMKGQKEGSGTMGDVYYSYLIYSLCGIPGSLVGGWLVDTKLGRKGTLALSILLDAFAQLGFIFFESLTLVTISSSAVSFLITLMYAVLYSYTPEIFDPRLRSTACGIAVSLSRLLAIISPMLTGILYSIRVWSPLEISTILLVILVALTLMLPIETRGKLKF